ncbi:MAG: hypothetical protein B7Y51_02005 [Burkholderiales bacterium 28-67-8]|nr:MAG: hypothetical protein B7Y51_02005 [Burkholderiales bacterium 28-67-8]
MSQLDAAVSVGAVAVAGQGAVDPWVALEAGRASGAAQADPVGFAVIEALARRAAAQQGEARELLMRRVDALLARHAALPDAAAAPVAAVVSAAYSEPAAHRGALGALSELIDRLGRLSASPGQTLSSPAGSPRQADAPRSASLSAMAPPASLKSVTAFKGTWTRLRADQRLREALAQVPAMAGPLNSSHLVNRALQTMRDVSPEYLDAFMSHIDTLLWLEQASGAGDLTPARATALEPRRRAATRSRKA